MSRAFAFRCFCILRVQLHDVELACGESPCFLLDPANHSPALMELVGIKLSRPLVEYVVDCVAETVDYALGRAPVDLPSRGRTPTRSPSQAQFGNQAILGI
ncbi:hypothetical protein B0H15DRAFT_803484 [Mycena belliarum]|uniref:Uncharacterized protein n=1 Tax=Mycena belliarum TaxID=1033014 RepID=A0AAD6TY73_9AGAR|nr:hypothetical protein B0H15DRAFT_803484 [Mycena belliae]